MIFATLPSAEGKTSASSKRDWVPGSLYSELSRTLMLENAQISGFGDSWSRLAPGPTEAAGTIREPASPHDEIAALGKLRSVPVATAIINSFLRNQSSREELVLELYDAPLSMRQIDDITLALWQSHLDSDEIRELHQQVSGAISSWLSRPLPDRVPIAFIEGTCLRWKSNREERCAGVLAAIGVNALGFREVLAVAPGEKDNAADCERLFQLLRSRGVGHIDFVIGDLCSGIPRGLEATYPEAGFQGCIPSFREQVFARTSNADLADIDARLDGIYDSADLESARTAFNRFSADLQRMGQQQAAQFVAESGELTLSVFAFPREIRMRLAGSRWVKKIFGELKERARTVGAFSDEPTAVLLVAAHLRQLTRLGWADRCFLRRPSRVAVHSGRRRLVNRQRDVQPAHS